MQIKLRLGERSFFVLFIFCILFSVAASAQSNAIGEMEQKLKTPMADTARVRLLQKISLAYTSVNPKKKFYYAKAYKELAEKLKIDSTAANGYVDMGVSYGIQSKVDSALVYFSKGYDKAVEGKYDRGIARALLSIGYAYARLDNKQEAVEKYIQALKIFKKLKYTRGINQCYVNIGSIYFDMAEYDMADKYFMASYKTYLIDEDEFGMAGSMFSLGNTKRMLGDLKQAKEYYTRSLEIRKKRGELNGIALATWGLGMIANAEKKYDEALELFKTAREINLQLSDVYQLSALLMSMSESYMEKGDFKKAEALALEGLEHSKQIRSLVAKTEAYERLTEIAKRANNIPKAFEYQTIYMEVLDSLKSERTVNDIKIAEFERVEMENANLIKDNTVIAEKSTNYLYTIFAISGLLVLVLLLSGLLYKRILEKKIINEELEKQRQETAEINSELVSQMQITAEQNSELEKLNMVKNKFFSIVSHDLRSPLSTLQMLFKLYRRGDLSDEEMNEMLIALEDTIYATSSFLDNLLTWSKSQLDGMTAKPEAFSLTRLVSDNIRLMETQVKLKELVVTNDVNPDITAFADPNMINVAIRNLFSNSVKFCRTGDAITMSAEKINNKVVFSIKDSGPGILKGEIDKLFDLAHTVSMGTSGESGHHIGLVLCKDMIEQNKGKIWVESEPGNGTTFRIELPSE